MSGPQTEYVCGFAFDRTAYRVVLIRKTKPQWQAGLWNGVGGKVEPGESLVRAMSREFEEETGLEVPEGLWHRFLRLDGKGWVVHFFRAFDIPVEFCRTTTEEVVGVHQTLYLPAATVPNLRWLVPLAMQAEFIPDANLASDGAFCVRQHKPAVEG